MTSSRLRASSCIPRALLPVFVFVLCSSLARADGAAGLAEVRFASANEGWKSTGLTLSAGQGVTLFTFADDLEALGAGTTANISVRTNDKTVDIFDEKGS